jgi:hypothetical protein
MKCAALLPPLLIVAIAASCLFRLWTGPGILYSAHSDLIAQGAGLRALERRTLAEERRWPLWDPSCDAGSPAHANPLTSYLSPLHWPFLVLPLDRAANLVLLLNVILAGLAMHVWARRRLEDPYAALFCGVAYMLSYRYLALIDAGWLPTITMYAYFPLLLWAAERLIDKRSPGRVAVFSVLLALSIMQGSAQSLYYAVLSLGLFVVWRLRALPNESRSRVALAFVLAGAAAVLLAAPDLLPRAQFAALSTRTNFNYPFFLGDPPGWSALTTFLDPRDAGGTRFEYWENNFYFGFFLYPLALWACLKEWRKSRVLLASFVAVILLCFDSPVLRFLFEYFPGFALFRRSTRLLQIAQFCAVALAGIGAKRLLDSAGRNRRPALAAVLCLLPVLDSGIRMIPRLTVLPLSQAFPEPAFGDMLRRGSGSGRVAAIGRTSIPYGTASYYGIDMINGYEPLNLRHYLEYFSVLQNGDPALTPRSPVVWADLRTIAKPEMLRALDAEYVVANGPVPLETIGYRFVARRDDVPVFDFYRGLVRKSVYLWQDERPLGAAYFARSLSYVGDEAASLAAVAASTSALDAHVFARAGEDARPGAGFAGGTARLTRRGENVYGYELDSRGDNFLILSQVWYPGWRARLDGRDAALSRVNHALIGLAVPPGRHVLELEMTSPALAAGLVLFCLGAAALGALFRAPRLLQ